MGSGHFLVSALNEILFIKSKIGVLVDEAGYKLKGYSFSIESDELIIKDDVGEIFEYKKGNETKTRLQKTLFKEKQTIIENCLFGVDINPNSVNICRLRLWIELLKNAYYKPDNTLDTLPNIDINIKCGNSLISRFGLTDDLNSKTIKAEIKDYKAKIADYKQNISTKQLVLQAIDNIKVKFQQTLKSTHNTTKKLNDALIQYVAKYSLDGLTSAQKLKAIDEFKLMGKQSSLLDDSDDLTDKARLKKVLENAWLAVEEIESGKIYQNAFEWRFEFPEVLNEGGDFVGFDVVIGNPPYGVKYNQYEKHYFIQKYETVEDIYTSFIELSGKITSVGAIVGLITPITWLTGSKYLKTRLLLLKDYSLIKAINLPYNIFLDAYVDTGLYFFQQKSEEHSFVFEFEPKTQIDKVNFAEIEFKKYSRNEWGIKEDKKINLNESDNSVFKKIDAITTKLESYAITARGILANKEDYRDEINAEKRKKVFIGNLNRYSIEDKYSSIEYGANLKEKPMSYDVFKDKRILVRRIISRQFRIMATIASDEFICKKDIYIVKLTDNTLSHEFVLGLLNSKLISYYKTKNSGSAKKDDFTQITLTDIRQIPIPIISLTLQEPLIQLVAQVILTKQNQQDTRQLEAEIDAMVYQLYQLTPDEISVIEAVN